MRPSIIAIAGPNGAGKSTIGPTLVSEALGVSEFVDADLIARGLSAFNPGEAAFAAGRIMISRIRELVEREVSFAFETTLSNRFLSTWIQERGSRTHDFHVFFLWLLSEDHALARVKDRIRMGGHSVPEATVKRRYRAGISNFFRLYRPLATTWRMYDNSGESSKLIASGERAAVSRVDQPGIWSRLTKEFE